MKLSVCLVTRNEERTLEQALGSVLPVADQIVVADTGSEDGTAAIARKLGAQLVPIGWDDDFSAARNKALALADGDWVFWLNPNETLALESVNSVREGLADENAFAYSVRIQYQSEAGQPQAFTEALEFRLFRRHPLLKYQGRLHPEWQKPLVEIADLEKNRLMPSAIIVRNHAYTSVLTEAKLRWALRLLEKELADRPGQLGRLIEYGRTLLRLNDPKGHAILAQAAEQVLTHKDQTHAPAAEVQYLLEYLLTVSPAQNKSRVNPEEAAALSWKWFSASPPLLWVMAAGAFRKADYSTACRVLERLIALGRTGEYDKSLPFNPRILGDDAVMNLGLCNWMLQDWAKAEACFRQLLGSPSHRVAAAKMLEQARAANKAPVDAFYSHFLGGEEP